MLFTLLLLWIAHALAFFAHEYAHSFMAWLLGWKSDPLALHYGKWTAGNILAQFEIDENVDYGPIFASGHNHQAGVIAAAGMVIGNGLISYPVSCWGYRQAKRRGSHGRGFFFYWLCVASIGNFIDYVPVRTFADHGDMHTLAKGFNCNPWWIIVVLGLPFTIALAHFFFWLAPSALNWLFPQSAGRRTILVFLTAFIVFGFYGAAGWSGYGSVSHSISVVSVYAFTPLMMFAGWRLTNRGLKSARQP